MTRRLKQVHAQNQRVRLNDPDATVLKLFASDVTVEGGGGTKRPQPIHFLVHKEDKGVENQLNDAWSRRSGMTINKSATENHKHEHPFPN